MDMFARGLLTLIRFYQRGISPLTPSSCRFYPTCSEYARQAVERHGAGRGSWLAARRLLRCRPFGPSGFDPVPERETGAERASEAFRPIGGEA